uniref:hypothetical protein n=1 Tax=Salmonella sp. s54836 TaxID=3159673 RepID=UPI00397F7836
RYLCTSISNQDDPWTIQPVCGDNLPSNGFISAVIGPTGPQNRGYDAITDQGGWGIAWYLNGKLIPEVYLKRGVTYSFTENGGESASPPANYHPFYLTDSSVGGIIGRANAGKDISGETVYAGLNVNSG